MRSQTLAGLKLLIFPEGTTTNGRLLITFKSGAFIPGVPVQPCVISYPREAGIFWVYAASKPGKLSPLSPLVDFFSHLTKCVFANWIYGGLSQPEILFRLFSSPYTRLKVKFLPVMYCDDNENAQLQDNRADAAHAARHYGTKG